MGNSQSEGEPRWGTARVRESPDGEQPGVRESLDGEQPE
jgi:hypothetical protein